MTLRRIGARMPEWAKRLVRRLAPAPTSIEGIEGWDLTLLGDDVPLDLNLLRPLTAGTDAEAQSLLKAPIPVMHTTRPLRCLLVADSLDQGGVDEFVPFLARGLRRRGAHVEVLVANPSPDVGIGRLGRELRADGIETRHLDEDEGGRWIREWQPDVVSCHGAFLWPLAVARGIGARTAVTLHGVHNVMGLSADELLVRSHDVDAYITVSALVREDYLARNAQFPPERIHVIANPVDPARALPYDRRACREALGLKDEFLFLSLARHSLQKNSYALVDAFGDVAKEVPGAHLLVCGRVDDPSYAQQIVALRDRLGLRDRVHLRDGTPHSTALLWAADALVLDSFFEGWSLASSEALGTGLPVILSDVGGAREQLDGGPSRGLLVSNPLGDPRGITWSEIAQARFRKQINRTELVEAMRSVASGDVVFADRPEIATYAHEQFSAAACIDEYIALLTELRE
ncbi:glycosyltransferase family 4 protein [Microbacterium sp. KUDC0406]|uniref:glycosyltransferase family 4 protein n=1 Tax=Microbacterium sp. KUDC0406 TaxID=2909588 RepID=UPI001F1888A7|nr:glycosyltransferase family 4 protein [Microbacterium sp. KUDC0406]UJP08884.1 glycosyltransferase family 4 protein [Microbacterium sp. KUDC0406]